MQIDSLRGAAEIPQHQAGVGFQFVDWEPNANNRGDCCGELCEPCRNGQSDWWCDGAPVRPPFYVPALTVANLCSVLPVKRPVRLVV